VYRKATQRKFTAKRRTAPSNIPALIRNRSSDQEQLDMTNLTDLAGFLICRAQLWVFKDFIRTLASLKVRPADFTVLSMVDANPGANQISLANALGIEPGHLVRLLHRLEKRGLVSRVSSVADRRSHALHLTDRGRRILAKSRPLVAEHEDRLAARLGTDQYEQIKRSLRVFLTG
jgi:DNA-binding MarR family transcriptional regulator